MSRYGNVITINQSIKRILAAARSCIVWHGGVMLPTYELFPF